MSANPRYPNFTAACLEQGSVDLLSTASQPAVVAHLLPLLMVVTFGVQVAVSDDTITAEQTFRASRVADLDDMCVWIHPTDTSLSTIIGSDKGNGFIYVFDLEGNIIQDFFTGKPGNVDVRYGIPLGSERVDLVAFNERQEQSIWVFKVDRQTRRLERVDDRKITGPIGEGFTLYKHRDHSLYGIAGHGRLKQYRLFDNGSGQISGKPTEWEFHVEHYPEGMVGDDETGYIYISDPRGGIWKVHALDHTDKTRIAKIGDQSGIGADVEGITIYYAANGLGYIIASSQDDSKFVILERSPPHRPVGEFSIPGVQRTDGVDVVNLNLNPTFAQGIFVFHNGQAHDRIHAVKWEHIAKSVGGLIIDTRYWDPRDKQ